MPTEAVMRFVRDALAAGRARADVQDVLLRAGWTPDQTRDALAAFADVEFPVPVPRPRPHLSAREALLYLTLFATLCISAYHFGDLIFSLINRAFPDAADIAGPWVIASMRWSVASLIVAFPVFLFLSRLVQRDMARDPNTRSSMVRRWLTYLTLFIGAAVLIGNATVVVDKLLGGELTIRFLLKAATVGTLAGSIFTHYLHGLRELGA